MIRTGEIVSKLQPLDSPNRERGHLGEAETYVCKLIHTARGVKKAWMRNSNG